MMKHAWSEFVERALEILFDTGVALALILSIWIIEVTCKKLLLHEPAETMSLVQVMMFHIGHMLVLLHWLKGIALRVIPVRSNRGDERR